MIAHQRWLQHIPSYTRHNVEWTDAMLKLLGKASDEEIAERFKMHRQTVAKKRAAMGITSARARRDKKKK